VRVSLVERREPVKQVHQAIGPIELPDARG